MAASLLAAGACREVAAPVADRVAVLAGAQATDTIDAVRTLRVAVTSASGRPVPGVVLRVVAGEGVPDDAAWRREVGGPIAPAYAVEPTGRQFAVRDAVHDTTDAEGAVTLRVRAGAAAGVAALVLSVPATGAADTVRLRIVPGAPASLHLATAQDTTLGVGATATLAAYVLDRRHNRRPQDAAIFTSADREVAVSADGRVTALAPVRTQVVAAFGTLPTEATALSVVPAGTVAVQRWTAEGMQLGVMALDGTGFTPVVVAGEPVDHLAAMMNELYPEWSADGRALLLNTGDALRRVETGGAQRVVARVPTAPTGPTWRVTSLGGERADGWIHYAMNCGGGELLFRTRPGPGGRTEQLSPDAADTPDGIDATAWSCNVVRHRWPSPSPDGRRAVLVDETTGGDVPEGLAVLDVATRVVTRLGVWGWRPSWSPDGRWIAYFSTDGIWLIRPDGSERRRLAMRRAAYPSGVTWSPDGAWLIVRAGSTNMDPLVLVEVQTGREIPLTYSYWKRPSIVRDPWFGLPAWRRDEGHD